MIRTFFGKYLNALREKQGKTKNQIIKESGIDRALYYKIEAGDRPPSEDALARLSKALGVEYSDLKMATFDDKMSPDDVRHLRRWMTKEDEDQAARHQPDFWLSLDRLEFEIQVAKMYRARNYAVTFSDIADEFGYGMHVEGEFVGSKGFVEFRDRGSLLTKIDVAKAQLKAEEFGFDFIGIATQGAVGSEAAAAIRNTRVRLLDAEALTNF